MEQQSAEIAAESTPPDEKQLPVPATVEVGPRRSCCDGGFLPCAIVFERVFVCGLVQEQCLRN